MPNNHRVVVNPASLPFDAYPIKLETATPFIANYQVTSSESAMRSTGKRIYDTSILPSSGTVTVQPGSPLLFPFITTQLPTTYFDAVFLITINGIRYLQGFSNSLDNVAAYTSNYFLEDKKMFALNLNCFGRSNNFGNSDANNHYMFGGDGRQIGATPAYLTFVTAPITDLSMTLTVKLYDYIGTNYPTDTINFVVPAGSLIFNIASNIGIDFYFYNRGADINNITGYFKCEVVSSDPSFVSILPFYHWGMSN